MTTEKSTQTLLNFADPVTARNSLFLSTDGAPFTTSRAVAERFGKKHKNVLRIIKKLLTDIDEINFNGLKVEPVNDKKTNQQDHNKASLSQPHFEPQDYIDNKGETRQEYRLSHDGFALLVMGFTGKEAFAWKVAFIQAFNQMETEVKTSQQRYLKVLDHVRPALRPVTESFNLGESRIVVANQIGKSVGAVTYHRRKAREFGLLDS